MKKIFCILLFLCISVYYSFSQETKGLSLPAIFGNNMVLQQNSEVPVWGRGIPGTTVVLKKEWGENLKTPIADNGKWYCKIKTCRAQSP